MATDTLRPPVPMEPVAWPEAFDDPGWLWQVKWDGVRCLADCAAVRLWSRRGLDRTGHYPALADELRAAAGGRRILLDGELVALGEEGRPSFPLIMRRALQAHPSAALEARIPVIYAVFDVLAWGDRDLRGVPIEERLDHLARLPRTPRVHAVAFRRGGGAGLVAAAAAAGLEGAVAKRSGSPYLPGPSGLWRKVKPRREILCQVVGSVQSGTGRLRALALAVPVAGELVYAGNVGSGLSEDLRARLARLFRHLPPWRPPFPVPRDRPDAVHRWVEPSLAATVTYAEWTPEGRLRAPVLAGLSPAPGPGGVGGPA